MKIVSSATWLLLAFFFAAMWNGEFSEASNSSEFSEATNSSESSGGQRRQRRSVVTLYEMVSCATNCNPISFKGYGCFCGFLGRGTPVDGLDKCCQQHDRCYTYARVCRRGEHYIAPYKFQCNYGKPVCATNGLISEYGTCGHRLCECDIDFVHCIKRFGCPTSKALCKDAPWRYMANRISAAAHRSETHYN